VLNRAPRHEYLLGKGRAAPRILNFSTKMCVANFKPLELYLNERSTSSHSIASWMEPIADVDAMGDRKCLTHGQVKPAFLGCATSGVVAVLFELFLLHWGRDCHYLFYMTKKSIEWTLFCAWLDVVQMWLGRHKTSRSVLEISLAWYICM